MLTNGHLPLSADSLTLAPAILIAALARMMVGSTKASDLSPIKLKAIGNSVLADQYLCPLLAQVSDKILHPFTE